MIEFKSNFWIKVKKLLLDRLDFQQAILMARRWASPFNWSELAYPSLYRIPSFEKSYQTNGCFEDTVGVGGPVPTALLARVGVFNNTLRWRGPYNSRSPPNTASSWPLFRWFWERPRESGAWRSNGGGTSKIHSHFAAVTNIFAGRDHRWPLAHIDAKKRQVKLRKCGKMSTFRVSRTCSMRTAHATLSQVRKATTARWRWRLFASPSGAPSVVPLCIFRAPRFSNDPKWHCPWTVWCSTDYAPEVKSFRATTITDYRWPLGNEERTASKISSFFHHCQVVQRESAIVVDPTISTGKVLTNATPSHGAV